MDKIFGIVIGVLFVHNVLFSQEKLDTIIDNDYLIKRLWADFDMRYNFTISLDEINEILKSELKLSKEFDFVLTNEENDSLEYTRLRYIQVYKGIPIKHSDLRVHLLNNSIILVNGVLKKLIQQ